MNFFAKLCMRVVPFVFSVSVVCAEDTFFKHSVTTEKKPWTAKKFLNDPADFQFAIVSDRTGGPRLGVFPKAVDKLNSGQVLKMLATDPGSVNDVQSWSKRTENSLLGHSEEGGVHSFLIQKK